MQYAASETGTYSTTIPTGTAVGSSYTVWYYCKGDSNHSDSAKASLTSIAIGTKALTPSVTCSNKAYDGTTSATCTVSLATPVSGETVTASGTCTFADANVGTGKTVTCSNLTLGGTNKGNYNLSKTSVTGTANITAVGSTVASAPTKKTGLTYTGSGQALATEGTCTGGTMQYATSETGTYSTTMPTGTAVGSSYTVWYYCKGDSNHSDSAKASLTSIAIGKKSLTPSISTCTNKTYISAYGTIFE